MPEKLPKPTSSPLKRTKARLWRWRLCTHVHAKWSERKIEPTISGSSSHCQLTDCNAEVKLIDGKEEPILVSLDWIWPCPSELSDDLCWTGCNKKCSKWQNLQKLSSRIKKLLFTLLDQLRGPWPAIQVSNLQMCLFELLTEYRAIIVHNIIIVYYWFVCRSLI